MLKTVDIDGIRSKGKPSVEILKLIDSLDQEFEEKSTLWQKNSPRDFSKENKKIKGKQI